MAPIKQHRDKTRRRKRPSEHTNYLLYKCMGDMCGEECDQELQPVPDSLSQRRTDVSSKRLHQHMEMDTMDSDPEDADYVDERERRSRQPVMKAGRVNKVVVKKTPAKQIKDIPIKLGLQKAERYLCNALDFGVQAGYLTPKDAKGRVFRVASGLLSTTTNSVKRSNTDAMDARTLVRRGVSSTTNQQMNKSRHPEQRDLQDMSFSLQEVRDDDVNVDDSKNQKRGRMKKSRSRSKRQSIRKRSVKSRSRSRSKRAHGRRRSEGRSRSLNPDSETHNKQMNGGSSEEQDDLDGNTQEPTGGSSLNGSHNGDDGKSTKSIKSSKSTPNNNNDSQTTSEDKKRDNDASNDDASDDDDQDKK